MDLSHLEQLAEPGQTEAVARIIGGFAAGRGREERGVASVVAEALASVSEKGLGSLGSFEGHPGEMSLPRAQELAAAINRVRSLEAAAE